MARKPGFLRFPWLAAALLASAGIAHAGTVHPGLEAQLAAAPRGALHPVIVELAEQGNATAAAARVAGAGRTARARAVVGELRGVAERAQPPVRALLAQELAQGRARDVQPLWVINAVAAQLDEGAIRRAAARPEVRIVRPDRRIPRPVPRPSAYSTSAAEPVWNIEVVRAPEVWAIDPAFSGAGIVVGSFDTGVDGSHPDLAPRYRGNDAISWFDPYGEHASPADLHGHGTHTIGTAVGGDASGYSIGVAPNARWIAAKAWNDAGEGTESALHRIFQWFLAPGGDPANAPHVVNSSWGLDPPLCFTEFRAGVQAFRAAGIVPVFAAGNAGPDPGTIIAPGSYAESFTVGATDFFEEIAAFSSQGPSNCDGGLKPNVSAPGVFILSAIPGGDYAYLDGTSMAAPHVSGAAAVLLSIAPELTVEEVEAVLLAGAVDLGPPGPDNAFGHGRIDVAESARIALENSGAAVVGVTAAVATAQEAGAVPGVFRIRRSGATDAPLAVRYAVGGTALAGSDYVALPGSAVIAAGAASVDVAVTPIDDAAGELDETVVLTLEPDPGYIAAPRQATITLVSDERPPDLVVSALAAPAGAGAGASIDVSDTTRNQGTSPSEATQTAYYLSADPTLDPSDTRLGGRAVPPLAAGASHAGSATLTLPPGLAAGMHYLLAVADADGAQVETSEDNNTTLRNLAIGPDLVVVSVTAPASAGAGQSIRVGDTTRNQAAGAAPASTTRYFLSGDAYLDASDVALGSRAVPALAPNASSAGEATVTIPAGTASGTYYLFARADAADAVPELLESNNQQHAMLRVGPDLTVASLAAPSAAGAGGTLAVTDTTRNAGSGAAPASTTRYYISLNAILDAGDAAVGSRAVPALAAGGSHSGSATLAIPADTPPGFYYLMAVADGDGAIVETVESNNMALRALEIGADLVVSALSAPADAGAGQAISVSDTTRNQGAGAAAFSTTTFILSSDWTLDAGDTVLGSRAVAALAPGASQAATTPVTIPAATPSGTYYLFARADGEGTVAELYETNNTRYATLRIGPDLAVTSLAAPTTGGAGGAITVTDTTRNAGAGAAAASSTRFYLSTNGMLDAADVALGARPVPALAAGASSTASTAVTIPPEVAAGSYWLLAVADGDGAVAETQEGNNTLLRAIAIGPDLVVASVSAPADAGAGEAVTVGDTTRNQGAGAAAGSATAFHLSADALLGPGDVLLGSRPVSPLPAGAWEAGTLSVTIPAATATGTYYLIARADGAGAVAELNEANNTQYRTIRVGPDLTVAAMTAPGTAGAGAAFTIGETTRNAGAGAAAATSTRFYLSANGVVDASDIALGARAVPPLAGGASDTGSTVVVVPDGTAPGLYYLLAAADGDGTLAETQENNNIALRTIQVGSDLVVTAITAPSDAGAGLPIVVGDTTRNQGAGTAGASATTYHLSRDALLDASDVALGSRAVGALAAGAADTGTAAVAIPAGTATGSYYLIARADGGEAVPELYETNNTLYRTLRVGPDLTVAAITAPTAAGAGTSIAVAETTRNAGAGASPASGTRYYLSVNGIVDAADALLGERPVPALAPGAGDAATVTLEVPAGTAAGAYWLIAVADGEGAVAETVESNNAMLRMITVGPDLVVGALTAPIEATPGQAIAVEDTTRNQGAGAAPASTTAFFLSSDWSLDGSDVLLGHRAVAALGGGASDSGATTLVLPAGLAPGTYYVIAHCDDGGSVGEIYETNNTRPRSIRVVSPP